ncbi:MAG: YihY/virulence factor BrkB family protein [Oscillospiraceae bacterium]|nr:YihY/virulence factor BrkB family protein [Oscillospiraceae bacterium]
MAFLKKLRTEIKEISTKLRRDSVNAHSAQAAFFVITSFFPFMLLLVTLVRFFPFEINIQQELNDNPLSSVITDFINDILKELAGKSASGAFLSAAGVSAIWAASRCLFAIIQGLNQVYGTEEKRSPLLLRLTAVVYVFVLQIIVIVSLGILVFGRRINDWLVSWLDIPGLSEVMLNLRWAVFLLVLILFFMFVYTVVPERKTRFLSEMPGAILSAVGWLGFSALFSMYIDRFSDFGAVYGSLAAAVILMLWLYFCMYILFLGAQANVYLQSKRIGILSVREYVKRKLAERKKG